MTLIVHIGAMKLTNIMHMLSARAKDTLTITEEPSDQSIPRDTNGLLGGTGNSTYFSIPSDK